MQSKSEEHSAEEAARARAVWRPCGGVPGRLVLGWGATALSVALLLSGCRSPSGHIGAADRAAARIIAEKQADALGRQEPFTIAQPSATFRQRLMLEQRLPRSGPVPEGDAGAGPVDGTGEPVVLGFVEALQLAAANSREYQARKESVFAAALQLDLERYRLDTTFSGMLQGLFSSDGSGDEAGVQGTGELGVQRRLEAGADLGGRLVFDLVRLLRGERLSSMGLLADASISVPLLRGSGRMVATEARVQAERDVVYALYGFELFKQAYAVQVAGEYLSVLQQRDQIRNAEASIRRLTLLVERTDALHEKGRVTGIQVDQARQNLLRAREGWMDAQARYERQLDRFKLTLGLPTDAGIRLQDAALDSLVAEAEGLLGEGADAPSGGGDPTPHGPEDLHRGRYEMDERRAVGLALRHRLDVQTALDQAEDARRQVLLAEDALRPGLDLTGTARVGERRGISSAGQPDARLRPSDGAYGLGLEMDLPFSRRAERVAYRRSLIAVEAALRDVQETEDQVKLEVRDGLRELAKQREQYQIQRQALDIAERRVRQAEAFARVGRAETRDVLEADEALLQVQNAVVDALVSYRMAELRFQRDLGLLTVDEQGLWEEFDPSIERPNVERDADHDAAEG